MKNSNYSVIVLGDLILDQYIKGEVSRISPEAPVLILKQNEKYHVLGGALNVSQNLKSLGLAVYPFGTIGNDNAGEKIIKTLKKQKISTKNILVKKNFITSVKTRFAYKNHHLLRLDNEQSANSIKNDKKIFDQLTKQISKVDFILISDYGKGVCSNNLLKQVLDISQKNNINVFIDPKGKNYHKYDGAFCITPNVMEAEHVLNKKLNTNLDFEKAAKEICIKFNIENCIITRGGNGSTIYDSKKSEFYHPSAKKVEVFDVSGAGDIFISVLAYNYSTSPKKSLLNSTKIAHELATESVKHFGTFSLESLN